MILYLFNSCLAFCQADAYEWKYLNDQHATRQLDDIQYFKKARVLVENEIKQEGLKENLAYYRKVAWSKEKYLPYRYEYYGLLANNAAFTHKEGAAIYYLEKSEQELKKSTPYTPSLNETRQLLAIYGSKDNYNFARRNEIFIRAYPYLKTLPQRILDGGISYKTCINGMTILNHASRLYASLNDSDMMNSIVHTSSSLWNSILEKNNLEQNEIQQCRYLYFQVQYTFFLFKKDFVTARGLLDSSYNILRLDTTINPMWARSVERALLRKYIDLFITLQQPDSSRTYVQLLVTKVNKNDPGDGTSQLLYAAKVKALENNYEEAYKDLLSAYEINDSIINLKTADINNNLYAQLVAEERQEMVNQLHEQTTKRNIIIGVIFSLFILAFILWTIKVRKNSRVTKERIEKLNRLTQIEIAELELRANSIQRKMSMELHDDVAGRLALLCNMIDLDILDETDDRQVKKLRLIGDRTRETYRYTRGKSHEWYSQGLLEERESFVESISRLVNVALPDNVYNKILEIDEACFQKVAPSLKIELLRIIQEIIMNVLKHARANKVELYIYEEDNAITVLVRDNGLGFDMQAIDISKSVGLRSLRDRVKSLNGSLEINSNQKGTEVVIGIPL